MVKLTTTNIVGTAAKKTWSQAQTVNYDETHQVMVVVQLTSEDEDSLIDLTTLGAEILSEIERKGQIVANASQLKELADVVVGGVTEGLSIELMIASLRDVNLIIYGIGEVEAYLSRDGKLAMLKSSWEKGGSVNGTLKVGDLFVLSTHKFVETISLSKFKEILTEDDEPAELLTPLLHTQTETSGVAAIVGKVSSNEKVITWPQIKLRTEDSPRKTNLLVGGVIFILLVIMIGVGMVQRVKQISEKNYTNLNTSVNAMMDETLSVGDLNPERARSLLSQARNEVEAYLETDITDEYKQRAKTLLGEIDSADERAFKKNDIKLSTVVELSILADGLTATKMKSDGKDNIVFIDKSTPRMVFMNINDRSRQIIDYKDNEQFTDISVSESRIYGLNTRGVFELYAKKDEVKKVIDPDEFWKVPINISTFAGNVYILDKEQGEIWKYPTLGEIFGGRRRWFAVGITPDLTNVVDMKVVGDIWLLTSTGKLERYSRGAPVTFGMEGFPAKGESKRLSEPSAVWVTDSLVYVLENGSARVVVFGVDGKYQSQYVNSEFAKGSDLVIVDDKGYVLIDNMVKEFGL